MVPSYGVPRLEPGYESFVTLNKAELERDHAPTLFVVVPVQPFTHPSRRPLIRLTAECKSRSVSHPVQERRKALVGI